MYHSIITDRSVSSMACARSLPRKGALLAGMLALASFAPKAQAALIITPIYSPEIGPEARTTIESAIKFYTDNFQGNVRVTVGFGLQPGGGASATYGIDRISYDAYLRQLRGNITESATDVSALGSLPTTSPIGNGQVILPETLAANLGLGTQNPAAQVAVGQNCAGLEIQACVAFGSSYLTGGANGGPAAGLFGVTQHEINEILGTASGLSRGSTATAPSAADLFRFGAPGVRSWSNDNGTAIPCQAGTPVAYLSINGGQTNLASYNNCNNGGDYGDFLSPADPGQVQDAFGPTTNPATLSLTSPESALLDATGWNYVGSTVVASGTPAPVTEKAVSVGMQFEGDPPEAVPEPATIGLGGIALALLFMGRRRVARR